MTHSTYILFTYSTCPVDTLNMFCWQDTLNMYCWHIQHVLLTDSTCTIDTLNMNCWHIQPVQWQIQSVQWHSQSVLWHIQSVQWHIQFVWYTDSAVIKLSNVNLWPGPRRPPSLPTLPWQWQTGALLSQSVSVYVSSVNVKAGSLYQLPSPVCAHNQPAAHPNNGPPDWPLTKWASLVTDQCFWWWPKQLGLQPVIRWNQQSFTASAHNCCSKTAWPKPLVKCAPIWDKRGWDSPATVPLTPSPSTSPSTF